MRLIVYKIVVSTTILLLGTIGLHAQEHLLVSTASANGKNSIWLKWLDEQVLYPDGVNIYRVTASSGERVKLNSTPLKRGSYKVPDTEMKKDTMLIRYMAMIDSVKREDISGFVSLVFLVKMMESNEYAKYAGVMYEDEHIETGEAYSYEVYKLSGAQEVLIERSPFIKAAAWEPYPSPDSLEVVAGDGSVSLRWQYDTKRFWGVNVYRKSGDDSLFTPVNKRPVMLSEVPKENGTSALPEWLLKDENLRNGTGYTYSIAGIDYFARPTLFSGEVTVVPRDKTPPIAPHNVSVDVGLLDITLAWKHDFKSSDMMGYHVYRSKGRSEQPERINKVLLPDATFMYYDTVPGPGVFVYYVAAVDSSGNEGRSFAATGEVLDIFPPAKPTGLQVVADTGCIILTWEPNAETDLMGYRIYRTVGSHRDDNYVLLNARAVQTTRFVDSLPRNARNFFFYKIAALDRAYNMSGYSEPHSSRMPDVVPPRAPFIIDVKQETKALRIDWLENAPEDSAGTIRKLNVVLIKAGMHMFTDHWAEANKAYRYFLTAVDSSGQASLPSAAYDAKYQADEICALRIKKLSAAVKRSGNIPLLWSVEVEEEDDYSGCILYRKEGVEGAYKPLTILSKDHKYTDKFNDDIDTHQYQVRAYSLSGCVVKSETLEVKNKYK